MLSKGFVDGDHIVCGYHGWTDDGGGACVRIPQQAATAAIPPGAGVQACRCEARYGYAWVALEEPLRPILDIPEDGASGFRRLPQFDERSACGALRPMENGFDAAHFAFVHRGSFGRFGQNTPEFFELRETDHGFEAETKLVIDKPRRARRSTDPDAPVTPARRAEQPMASDRPGILMRQRLLALLQAHGETEIHRGNADEPQESLPCS
jgi:phenylpropionate dioxygenase-like ring-hydroxylating dioxygenase large terminal subunit